MIPPRIVVIDDEPSEAAPLLEALGKAGIGSVYFRGDVEAQLPDRPLTGIRLVFLDLQLVTGNEPRHFIPHAIATVARTAVIEPQLTGIVCWTKNEEAVEALKRGLEAQGLSPAFIDVIEDKVELLEHGDAAKVMARISAITDPMTARRLLEEWELRAHEASTDVTESLWRAGDSDDERLRLLAAIARAHREPSDENSDNVRALWLGLSSVHRDALETAASNADPDTQLVDRVTAAVDALTTARLEPATKARLNSALLTSPGRIAPGALFVESGWCTKASFPADCSADDVLAEIWPDGNRAETVRGRSRLCVLEITPACDHANRKAPVPRLLTGVLVVAAENGEFPELPKTSRLFAKTLPPIHLRNSDALPAGDYELFLSARRLVSCRSDDLAASTPVLRLRHDVLVDIRAWFAAHAARPGIAGIA